MTKNLYNEFSSKDLNPKNKKKLLMQQELDVNLEQQVLVNQRINLIKDSFKEIPNTDPEYSILFTQLEMDQVELDELKNREIELENLIKTLN